MVDPFPLSPHHIRDARVHADRNHMIADLGSSISGGAIAEVGVALGDFSEFLVRTLDPSVFVGFDTFDLHHSTHLWGRPSAEIFGGQTHLDLYRDRMKRYAKVLRTEMGPSHERLATYEDKFFDLIYVDAEHTYESVKRDAAIAADKLRDGGLLVFNDYIMYDPFLKTDYGVVQVVNEMAVKGNWKIVGFALQRHMFCDVALRRF